MIFEIKTKIGSTRQGQLNITEYYNRMKGLWLELDHYQDIKMVCSANATTLNQIFERDRILEFLASLNPVFDQVRIQILSKDKLSTLNEVFAIVMSEENKRGAILYEYNPEGSTLMATNKEGAKFKLGKTEVQTKNSSREGQWCSYCKKA